MCDIKVNDPHCNGAGSRVLADGNPIATADHFKQGTG
jgi:hypothetical protein